MRKLLFLFLTMILTVALVACDEANDTTSTVDESKETEDSIKEKTNENDDEEEVAEEDKKTDEDEQESSEDVPREYKAALKSAETYSDMMHMSKKGIYEQLISEYGDDFPEDAAQYAVDNLEADYKENALKSAETYAEMMDMSDNAIYDQLISEYGDQFTEEEAQYAIDNLK